MSTLGEQAPDIAKQLGLDVETLGKDSEVVGKLAIVTFREPHYDTGGRRDPVADLPPTYSRYGIVDREHRDKVKTGETWIVRPYQPPGSSALFLVLVAPLELSSLLALDKTATADLARELAKNRPDLAEALADYLPKGEAPADPTVVKNMKAALAEARSALEAASAALGAARGAVESQLEAAADEVARAKASIDLAAPIEKRVKLVKKDRPRGAMPLYLADANLFINAERWKWPDCNRILNAVGVRIRLATTKRVREELLHSYRVPDELEVIDVGEIDAALRELADANASAVGKKAGEADLSLIQAMLDNDDIRGIITEDPDIGNIHPASVVKQLRGRDVECLTAAGFVSRHRKLAPPGA